ncbi:PREDICTED: AF4/FMR2 family member 4 isoform X5 [Rhagoletis zephyria]|uniref:AF4/FMR2 family member 4 isoform X4 n=1 Tax=Rhagoletis zephyria TaxID=28612 RepID=UPI000811607F|nr:PREDICTED: AF4/FMR2 family member 4 isoform X4 [Rhagoletis zephyria]XP_017474487.1 PREDICTED: AF4/FMR2 family member 4 isoform X5 [Rhagoletis zephyria]
MREFSKKFTKPNEMDMKKIPKARMEDLERRQQREREKHKRQQVQSVGREYALFPEPRRVNPSEVDDDITAKLGDHSKAIEFMNTDAVGVQPSSNNALLTSHIQTSASSSSTGGSGVNSAPMLVNSSSSSQRPLTCPSGSQQPQQSSQQTHHYQQQAQQQLRQTPYLKPADNKPPYNGRGGFPGQPVKNDLRSSSGMAPPKGPPPLLPPPTSTLNTVSSGGTNNCSNSSSNAPTTLLPPPPNGYLGPPKSTAPLHNGRFSKPLPKSINDIISKVDQTYRAPEQITKIAATPRTTIGEYNLNGPNRHKYSIGPIQPILGSPPSGAELLQSAVPPPITPISALPATPNPQAMPNADAITTTGSSSSFATSSTMTTTTTAALTTAVPTQNILNASPGTSTVKPVLSMSKEPLKPLLLANKVGPTLEKQSSTLENDLELSESDEDRKKQSHSMHNSSDSSPSDSSESGSEESSKSERQQPPNSLRLQQSIAQQQKLHTHHPLQNQQHVQQQQILQQTTQSIGRAGVGKAVNDKSKLIEPLGSGRSSIYLSNNALGSGNSSNSGPSSTSLSANKTPSPSESSKWHLSRYFNKKPAQALNETTPPANSLVVNSINVSMDEPTLLPGGAQIIPEATQSQPNPAIVKHEAANYGTAKKYSARSDDDDEEIGGVRRSCDARGISSNACGLKSSIGGGIPALLNEIKKESDVLYPSSLLKTGSSGSVQTHLHIGSQQQQQQQSQVPLLNAAEFVAIPTSQIKHEVSGLSTATTTTTMAPMSLAGGTTTVTPYNTCGNVSGSGRRRTPSVSPHMRNSGTTGPKSGELARVSRLSAPSSDGPTSNTTDDEDNGTPPTRQTVPTLGPGGTLKIPGVPAAITALPPSPPQPLAPAPTLPNSITVLPIDPLPTTVSTRRRKKPRISAATVSTHLDTSDEEGIAPTNAPFKSAGVTVSPAALRAAAGPGGKLYAEPVPAVAAKKGPGRPRKIASSGTTASASTAVSKGPTLTAKKDMLNSVPVITKKSATRRRGSRQNSSSATTATATKMPAQTQQPDITAPRAPILDSSSSSSTSCSTSKSSSSSSDSEEEEGVISGSSSDDEDEDAGTGAISAKRNLTARPTAAAAISSATAAAIATNTLPVGTSRIIVQLNKRKSSHEDMTSATATSVSTSVGKTSGMLKLSNSSKRRRPTPQFAHHDEQVVSGEDSSDSGSGSDDSSVSNFVAATSNNNVNVVPAVCTGNVSGGSSHRSQNLQSPYKVPNLAAPVSSSSSSSNSGTSSFSGSSSGGEHSDIERSATSSNRVKGKHSKTGVKASTCASSTSSGTRLRRDKPKASDKNKNVTLTRIFNPKEGGAKKQGQVLVIDQSSGELGGEQQQQKLISPNAGGYRTTAAVASAVPTSQEHHVAASTTAQSPRLTPGHMKSPRAISQLTAASAHRTPDRSSRSSAERKVHQQRIKTPSCTPTRTPPATRTPTPTPTPAGLLSAPTASPIRTTAMLTSNIPSLICKVDLSRLRRILPEWRANTYRLSNVGAGSSATSRCAHHEAILNADLQATTIRIAAGGSGSVTPHSTGNRTPTTPHAPPDRELSRSRESLMGINVGGGKQRLSTLHSNRRLSSRSTDGGGSGETTPKEQPQLTPNGYSSKTAPTVEAEGNNSPSTKQLLKHEQLIKNEPGAELDSTPVAAANKGDAYGSETKFKTTNSVKQEVLLLKQDSKLGLPHSNDYVGIEKQDGNNASPISHLRVSDIIDNKSQRRKRSASSSPYKEKKRKKEKTDKYSKEGKEMKEGKESGVLTTPTTMAATCKEKEIDKDVGKLLPAVATIERDIGSGAISSLSNANDTSRRAIAIIPPLGMSNNGQMEKEHQHLDSRQLSHTNHDRLLVPRQIHQQQPLANATASNSSNSPAHLQTAGNNLNTAPIAESNSGNVLPSGSGAVPLAPPPQVIYRSYFERDDDGLCDDISENSKFLQEAVKRKHAADKEQNLFNQVTLYLEAVIYFLLSSAGLEQHRNSEESSWVMYKDTLNLIKFISSKIKHLQVSSSANELHEPHNKVAILSLRCQSLISLKLYKMKRHYCRSIINHCMEIFKSGRTEILNGNTPSSNSPSNSVCSQGSGSNTPPGRSMRPDMHTTLSHQNLYFNYLANCHDLWDQADRLVRQGNHTDFFIALDHENGPLTLHSSMYDLFRYVQSGLKKLKSANTTITTTAITTTSGGGSSGTVTGITLTSATSTAEAISTSNTSSINKCNIVMCCPSHYTDCPTKPALTIKLQQTARTVEYLKPF